MKLHLPRRRSARVVIYLSSLVLVLIAIDLILVQVRRTIRPGFDTTRLTSPLQSDGSVDYLLAIDERYGRGVTPENNAAVLVLQALGREALAWNQPPDGITERMGMPHLPETGDYFVPFRKYLQDNGKPAEELRAYDAFHWPVTISPQARQWVKANEKPLNLIVAASQRSRFFIPCYGGNRPETLFEILLPHLARVRDAHVALRTRALIKLEAGDVAGFHDDLIAMQRLGRLLTGATTFIDRLVGIAIERSTCRTARAAAVSGKLSRDQLKTLRADFASFPETPPFADVINTGERYGALDMMQSLARSRGPNVGRLVELVTSGSNKPAPAPSAIVMKFVPIPYEKSMRRLNSLYDYAVAASQEPTFLRRREAFKRWEEHINSLASHTPLWGMVTGNWPAQLLLPALSRADVKADMAVVDNQLAQIALALAAYKADHNNAYPATLAELTPQYLASIPLDRFTEKPLIYEAKGEGYRLYSVGPNGVDNGGKFSPPPTLVFSTSQPAEDDISADWP